MQAIQSTVFLPTRHVQWSSEWSNGHSNGPCPARTFDLPSERAMDDEFIEFLSTPCTQQACVFATGVYVDGFMWIHAKDYPMDSYRDPKLIADWYDTACQP